VKNKLLTISCDSFTFESALKNVDEESLKWSISKFIEYISDEKNEVSREDLKQLGQNISIQDDPAKSLDNILR